MKSVGVLWIASLVLSQFIFAFAQPAHVVHAEPPFGVAAQLLNSARLKAPLPVQWKPGGLFGWEPYAEFQVGQTLLGLNAQCSLFIDNQAETPVAALLPTDVWVPSLERSSLQELVFDLLRDGEPSQNVADVTIRCIPHQGRRWAQKPARVKDFKTVMEKILELQWKGPSQK